MTFHWKCPVCSGENFYSGSKTTNVVVKCKKCNKGSVKASSHKIIKKKENNPPQKTTSKLPRTTNKLPVIKMNGSVKSLIIALNYAINTIKLKKQVVEKDVDSTWYQHYKSWTSWRSYLQALEEDK